MESTALGIVAVVLLAVLVVLHILHLRGTKTRDGELSSLVAMLRKVLHQHGYSDPSGAAPVTEGAEHGGEAPEPAEALRVVVRAVDGVRRELAQLAEPGSAAARAVTLPLPAARVSSTAERIGDVFLVLVARSGQAGTSAAHCNSSECTGDDFGICACPCDPCGRRVELHRLAEAEVLGRPRAAILPSAPGASSVATAAPAVDVPRQPSARGRLALVPPAPADEEVSPVGQRWDQLRAEAVARGEVCAHCLGADCWGHDAEGCLCSCAGCYGATVTRRVAELRHAVRVETRHALGADLRSVQGKDDDYKHAKPD